MEQTKGDQEMQVALERPVPHERWKGVQKGNDPAAGLQTAPFSWVGTGGPLSEP